VRDDRRGNVCVVGSINVDLVMRTPRFPSPGETLLGGPYQQHPGGKGANQAVAAARCGARVEMIGCVGDDEFGGFMRDTLRDEGIGIKFVATIDGVHTGVAQITVDASGENCIVVAPGANGEMGARRLSDDAISRADVLLAQLEIPMPAVFQAATKAKAAGAQVVLNAAPAAPLPRDLVPLVDVLVVNQREAATISGLANETRPDRLADALAELGFETVVLTLGEQGAYIRQDGAGQSVSAVRVEAVDTVGAGDAFTGALAALLARGDDLSSAAGLASAAGAIAVTRHGAIPSLPRIDEVEALAASLA